MKIFKNFQLKRGVVFIVGLLVFTILLWMLFRLFGERVLVLSPNKPAGVLMDVRIETDKRDKGTSTGTLTITPDTWKMKYSLKPTIAYPFVMLQLVVGNEKQGLDCSKFDEIHVYADARGQGVNRFRMEFRNAHPAYTHPDDPVSLKYNQVHFPPRGLHTPQKLTWAHFQVPGWWIAAKNIPFNQSHLDVSNVETIDFVTPEGVTEGSGVLEVKRIELHGKWISGETFFKITLIFWMIVFGLYAVDQTLQLHSVRYEKKKREKELLQMNEALALQADELKEKAERDPLTGLLNRFGMRTQLLDLVKTVQHNRIELTAVFVDIDYFKRINDTLGHQEGDRILKFVATVLSNNKRDSDILARWGGEEFLFFCASTDEEEGYLFAEKLRKQLVESAENVTCSFGVATLSGGSVKGLIGRADRALYQAKDSGRNCVFVSKEPADKKNVPSIL
jgi:diguanylate cyclase (GGDEF)-like protein